MGVGVGVYERRTPSRYLSTVTSTASTATTATGTHPAKDLPLAVGSYASCYNKVAGLSCLPTHTHVTIDGPHNVCSFNSNNFLLPFDGVQVCVTLLLCSHKVQRVITKETVSFITQPIML